MFYYAGIGSRETPKSILDAFCQIGSQISAFGGILRSGRAPGADSAFETGCANGGGKSEIFLPWQSFSKDSPLGCRPAYVFDRIEPEQKQRALDSINKYHPAPSRLSQGAVKLIARDYLQMFGPTVNSPATSLVVCYTRDGKASGGTGQAMRIAIDNNIKIMNAYGYENRPDDFVRDVLSYCSELLKSNSTNTVSM